MEVVRNIQREYNPAHPNYERWKQGRELSEERARFVERVISEEIRAEGITVLDFGAGEGHTSSLFSKKNIVISLEPKPERLRKIPLNESLHPVIADNLSVPFKRSVFDLIILQDVLEHLEITEKFIERLTELLKECGLIYISTPNKLSILNIISDPHWGMPMVSILKRTHIKKYFLKYFRKSDMNRKDIAQLLSLSEILTLFHKKFEIKLCTNFSVSYLFNDGRGLIWSKFHVWIVRIIKSIGLQRLILLMSNNRPGFVNKYLTPTFYIVLRKK